MQDRESRMKSSLGRVSKAVRALTQYKDEDDSGPLIPGHKLRSLASGLEGVVGLSSGSQSDVSAHPAVYEAARKAYDARIGPAGQWGLREFRVAVAEKLQRVSGATVDPDREILPTIGCQYAIFAAILILVDPGDEVLIMDPEYPNIAPLVSLVGGVPVYVPYHRQGASWIFKPEQVESRISPATKLFIFSNGANPTGVLMTADDLKAIAALASRHNFYVFADEENEGIAFDGRKHASMNSLPDARDRVIAGFSFSKAYAMSGFRIGYMVGPDWILDFASDLVYLTVQSCPTVSQRAAIVALSETVQEWLRANAVKLQAKRDFAVDRLNSMPGVRCSIPSGCYFLFPEIKDLGLPSSVFAERLLKEEKVLVRPGEPYGPSGVDHVRVSFCVSQEDLAEGLNRFERFVRRCV